MLPTRPSHSSDANQAENDVALVVLVELGGVDVLVPGDAEGPVLTALGLPPIDVLELPHHGSSGGLDAELLVRLHPQLAVVSVGPNRFGHPTPEMTALLAAHGVPLLRTDHAGDIVVCGPGDDGAAAESRAEAGAVAAAVTGLRVWTEKGG